MTDEQSAPFLDVFAMREDPPKITPGQSRRQWMDETNDRYAYRCLPLTMANSTGWEIECPFTLDITWNGGQGKDDVAVSSPDKNAYVLGLAQSHFLHGIVTFHTGYLFRTPSGWATWVMGPPNSPKDGIYPLTGLVETDWLPFPFTMNWKMTRPGTVRFEKGEPFCFITLIEHNRLDTIQPDLRTLNSDPELKADCELWHQNRQEFLDRLAAKDAETVKQGWQRNYMRGEAPSGKPKVAGHNTKRQLKTPKARSEK